MVRRRAARTRRRGLHASLAWREELSHAPGSFQANPIAALADFAGVLAGLTLLPSGSTAATIAYTLEFFAEARGARLLADARVLSAGRTITVSSVELIAVRGPDENACAAALVRMRNYPAKS